MQDAVNLEKLFSRRLDCRALRVVLALFFFCGAFLSAPIFMFVAHAQEQGGVAELGSEDKGLDSLDAPETAESSPDSASASKTGDTSLDQPPALGDGVAAETQKGTALTDIPPQPEQDIGSSASTDLSGLEVAVSPQGSAGTAQQATTEEGFDKMLERKGKPQSPTTDSIKQKIEEDDRSPFKPDKIRSLFFTFWQHQAIVDAKKSRGLARPPTERELRTLDKEPPKPGERDLTLDGIVFVSSDEWTIWLNGMRVTPSAIPKEVIDLRVFKEFIEVKWLDEYTNQVFPIRLRAHQRFNLDMRIFLPG